MSFWMGRYLLMLILLTQEALGAFKNENTSSKGIAIIGEGVIGLSTAFAIKQQQPDTKAQAQEQKQKRERYQWEEILKKLSLQITIFHDVPFNMTLSKGIAGLYRIPGATLIERLYGNETFLHLAELWRTHGGFSGVQLLSGHILSEDIDLLLEQEKAYADIVYNFRFLSERELKSQFTLNDVNTSHAIHYTAFTSEGAKYCPWMKNELLTRGVKFVQRRINSLDELADEGFSIVVNCAGLNGGYLAGDDEVYPIRGILLKVEAPWQKHFLMRDFITFTIPTIDAVYIGTVKEDHKDSMEITDEEKESLFKRYLELQPSFKNVKVVDHFVGIRPGRSVVRVEAESRTTQNGTTYKVVHNYGHGGSGFTIGWGTARHASALVLDLPDDRYVRAQTKKKSKPIGSTTKELSSLSEKIL